LSKLEICLIKHEPLAGRAASDELSLTGVREEQTRDEGRCDAPPN